jgi:hypothetical protein
METLSAGSLPARRVGFWVVGQFQSPENSVAAPFMRARFVRKHKVARGAIKPKA